MNKLVRNKMVDIIQSEGRVLRYTVLSDNEYQYALRVKLLEEATEVKDSDNIDNFIEELADVQEVIDCLLKVNNLTKNQVKKVQTQKRRKRGSFDKKYFIVEEM